MRMTPEERKQAMENPEFVYVNINHVWTKTTAPDPDRGMLEGGFVLDWGAKKIGFGQLEFRQYGTDVKNLKIECRSEHMGPNFVKKALEFFVNSLTIVE